MVTAIDLNVIDRLWVVAADDDTDTTAVVVSESDEQVSEVETITHAYFFLIRERMARFPTADWDEFSRSNADLLTWKDGILTRYYKEATLKSDLARTVFVFPDKVI